MKEILENCDFLIFLLWFILKRFLESFDLRVMGVKLEFMEIFDRNVVDFVLYVCELILLVNFGLVVFFDVVEKIEFSLLVV